MSVRIWISFFTFAVNLLFNLVVASSWVHPSVLVRSVLLIVLVFCVVLLCVFAFWVPCCDVHYDFAWKRCSIRLYLQLFVGELMSYLRYSCLIAYSDVQHTICCDFALFFLVLCTLCCQFLWIFFLVFRLKPVLCCQFLWIVFVLFFALSLCTLCCQFLWIVCFVFRLKLVYPMLPVSLDCLFCFSP
jgi:hypothetical protein